jgi:hypothetical protein
LAGVLGHELNNIAVPLAGFAELALQSAGTSASVRPMLDEIKIAVARIQALAADLESLGERSVSPTTVAIGACIPEAGGAIAAMPGIVWHCSANTLVAVDSDHARRALAALAATAGRNGGSAAPPDWSIAQELPGAAPCAVCGVRLPRADHVMVRAFGSRLPPREALRDPFGPGGGGRPSHRLGLAVLVHSTHCAGGHLFEDAGAGSLRLSFPLARTTS